MALDFPIVNANIETDNTILDKNQSWTFIEKGKLFSCEENGSSTIDNGKIQNSYTNALSCTQISSSVSTTKDFKLAVIIKISPILIFGSISYQSEKKTQ